MNRMARYASFVTFAALVLDATGAFAQQKPNFSGRWVSTSNPNRYLTVAQDATRLVITDEGTLLPRTLTYQLDGSTSRNATKTLAGETWTHESDARWVTNALVITTATTREHGATWESMTIFALAPDESGNLIVTTLEAVLAGPGMALESRVYRKG